MLFTDPLFLFYFLPLALISLRVCTLGRGFAIPGRLAIIVATVIFYGYGNILWPLLFFVVVGGIYAFNIPILLGKTQAMRRFGVIGAVIYAVASLALFKYMNWLVTLWSGFGPLHTLLLPYFGEQGAVILPPGISFFVFEALSFAIDAYRGRIVRPVKILDYITFLAMFPRFIAGPIVRYTDMDAQFKSWSRQEISQGLAVFALGFGIKSLFADQFAVFVPYAFDVERPDMLQSWAGALAYTFQLYFDFWGYSLMAIGLGLCLGFTFPDNFRSPYRAAGFSEFWKRWHISLSQWLRDYLYISMGGNRGAPWRVMLNLFLTMLIGGLWHGASFTFVAWGAYHGILLVAERVLGEERLQVVPLRIRQALTFLLVLAGWVLFRAVSLAQAREVMAGMIGLHGFAPQFNPALMQKHTPSILLILVAFYFWTKIEPRVVGDGPIANRKFSARTQCLLFFVFLVALMFSMSSTEIPFLYFQF